MTSLKNYCLNDIDYNCQTLRNYALVRINAGCSPQAQLGLCVLQLLSGGPGAALQPCRASEEGAVNLLALQLCMYGRRGMPLTSDLADAYLLSGTVLVTAETPSTNFVRKMTLALLNMPSFRETTMNWE